MISGIFLLDKPEGPSSARMVQYLKKLLGATKAGHTGTLDPLATGMLPIFFGEATKFACHASSQDKVYWVQARLGMKTNTGDRMGHILSECATPPALTDAQTTLNAFIGQSQQKPPMYSALKKDGQPLYRLARRGIVIEREPRSIEIFSCTLIAYTDPMLTFQVHCSKGTYVRSLVEDMGELLGCLATVWALRRLSVGQWKASQMHTIHHLESIPLEQRMALLFTVDAAVAHLPRLSLSQESVRKLQCGQPVCIAHHPSALFALYHEHQFIGLGHISENGSILTAQRLMRTES